MRLRSFSALAFGLALAAACSSGSSTASSSSSSSSSASSVTTAASTSSSASATATLAVATNAKLGKPILVDGKGRTVYLFVPDGTSTTSKVPDAIKPNWPAVTVSGAAVAGDGVDSSKLSTAMQADGTQQAVYNGHLLYTFAQDTATGDAKGEGLGSSWYVLSPAGDEITS